MLCPFSREARTLALEAMLTREGNVWNDETTWQGQRQFSQDEWAASLGVIDALLNTSFLKYAGGFLYEITGAILFHRSHKQEDKKSRKTGSVFLSGAVGDTGPIIIFGGLLMLYNDECNSNLSYIHSGLTEAFEVRSVFQSAVYSADESANGSLRRILTSGNTIREIPHF